MTKNEIKLRLSLEVIRQDVVRGRYKWKVTEINRKHKVARSRIYEVIGRNKKEMLVNSLKFILREVYGISENHRSLVAHTSEFQGLLHCRRLVLQTPELLAFYFRNRSSQDEIGRVIRSHEREFLEVVRRKNKISDPAKLLFVRTVIHGISLAPFLNDEEVRLCFLELRRHL